MADPYPVTLDSKDFTLAANGALDEVAATEVITASNHNLIQSAIVELEEKVGVTSSAVVTSLDYLLKSTSSGDPGHLHTKVGTIATGVWNGTAVADEYGGTGQTTYAAGDILYASGADTLAKLAKGSDTQVLTLASGLPEWAAAGAGPDFTEAVTITIDSASTAALTVTQEDDSVVAGPAFEVVVPSSNGGPINALEVLADGTVQFSCVDTYASRNPSVVFKEVDDENTEFKLMGYNRIPRVHFKPAYNLENFYTFSGTSTHGMYIGLDSGTDIWKLGTRNADIANLSLTGADKVYSVGFATGSSFDLTRHLSITVTENTDAALMINQSGSGDILDLQDGGASVLSIDSTGVPDFTVTGSSSSDPESDPEEGFIAVEVNGVAKRIPYYPT